MSVLKTATSSRDPDKTPVAKDVFTFCTKEKTDTWHVVMAHNSAGIVERVKCKACSSEHKYKRQNPLVVKASSSGSSFVRKVGQTKLSAATKSSTVSSASLENTWLAGLKKWGQKPVLSYSPDQHFLVSDVVNHQIFGKGVVQSRRENRIDVLFNVGLKTLPSTSRPVKS